ncbi:PRTRC system ThiF family protein [Robbsia andropogonis]|uniref:PRTRC system ThiF family protein n=1 Tax=Robbsia andropogonis TaxID=28092 RepID=UPI002A6B7ED2|nr:PRTRC system ThiF family protein [Robbsia andropogonis]
MSDAIQHRMPSRWSENAWKVSVIGAGGTGSAVLPHLARLHHAMVSLGHPGGIECTVFDDDLVSESNVGRQGFYPVDVGQPKASILVNRINLLMGTQWKARVTKVARGTAIQTDGLVIGCVDTRGARAAILQALCGGTGYYMDCGNASDSGQVVVGHMPRYRDLRVIKGQLPHVGLLFPEIVDPRLDDNDEVPSCSMAEALRKQSLVINHAVAVQAFTMLWSMFRYGGLAYCASFVNTATGRSNTVPIDPVAWERFGYSQGTKALKGRARRGRV